MARLTEEQVRAIRAAEGAQRAIAEQFGTSQAMVSRIKRGARYSEVEDMPDEPTADGVMEGAEVEQPLTPEDAVAVQQGLQRKLMAMGETVDPAWDITTLQAKISAKQREALMNEAAGLGINTMGMNWSIEVLQAKIAEARTPVEPPEGIAVVAIGLTEGEGEEVTCISRQRVSLGNGQWLAFKEKARVPVDMAALLREKDLCL